MLNLLQDNKSYILVALTVTVTTFLLFKKLNNKKTNSLLNKKYKNVKQNVTLIKKQQLSPDTYIFTFDIGNKILGISNGQHIKLSLKNEQNELISRNYTPITNVNQIGYFSIVVKIYRPNISKDFPNGGEFTPLLEKLEINQQAQVSGPVGRLHYKGNGIIALDNFDGTFDKKQYKNFIMIAGGTGITPMYQLIQASQEDKKSINIQLLYINRNEEDILMKQQLDQFKQLENVNINYSLTRPGQAWEGLKGRFNEAMSQILFNQYQENKDKCMVLLCGPPQFCESAKQIMKKMEFNNIITF